MKTVSLNLKSSLVVSLVASLVLVIQSISCAEVATMTDTAGASNELNTLKIECPISGHGLNYHEAWLDNIYSQIQAIPLLQKDGTVLFPTLDKVTQFANEGEVVTISLLNGKTVNGKPLSGCVISGDTPLGSVAPLSLEEVKVLKLNLEGLRKTWAGKPAIENVASILEPYKVKATISLQSGTTLALQNIALVYEASGIIPGSDRRGPRPYQTWNLMDAVPVKHGKSDLNFSLTKIQTLEVMASKSDEPKAPTMLHIKATNGQELNVTLNSGEGALSADRSARFSAIGFLGITDEGYAHVPLKAIKSISVETDPKP